MKLSFRNKRARHPYSDPGFALLLVMVMAGCAPAKKEAAPTGGTADPGAYTRITIVGDPSPTGVFDPFPVFEGAQGWMAYSGVAYHNSAGNLVQDVQSNVAGSTDAGATWTFVKAVATPQPFTVTAPDTTLCGAAQCTGHLISEVPFLVHDATDPDPAKRWKMFGHRYFLYPAGQASGTSLQYVLGAIYLQTASSPDGTWTAGTPVLGWNGTPPEIPAATNVQSLGGASASCLAMSEGAGIADGGDLDLVFTCIYPSGGTFVQKITLFRSTDHAATFSVVGDLVTPADAPSIGGTMPTAPALVLRGSTPVLLVTPISSAGLYAGCASVDVDDLAAAHVTRASGVPVWNEIFPTQSGQFGGACAYSDGGAANGVVMIQLVTTGAPADPFRIFATHVSP